MKAFLTLGCEGYTENGICFCCSVKNNILDLEKIKGTEHYFDLIKYLDNVAKLFNGICNKTHIITNLMYKLYEWEYINEKFYYHLSYFYDMHRRCGMTVELSPKEN